MVNDPPPPTGGVDSRGTDPAGHHWASSSSRIPTEDKGCGTDPVGDPFAACDLALHNRICTGCSCLCDDISFFFRKGQPLQALNLCEIGWKRLEPMQAADRPAPPAPERFREQARRAARFLADNGPTLVLISLQLQHDKAYCRP